MQRILENNSVCETDPKMKVTLRENERKEREVWYSPLGCNGNQYENLIKHIKWGEVPGNFPYIFFLKLFSCLACSPPHSPSSVSRRYVIIYLFSY